jgi:hypothetical protein
MTDKTYSFFSIGCYDEDTGMTVHEVYLENFSLGELPLFLRNEVRQLEAKKTCTLDSQHVMEFAPFRAEFSQWRNLPIRLLHECSVCPYRVHSGRELDMMRKGVKPLAVFSRPSASLLRFLREYFDPLVAGGELVSDQIRDSDETAFGAAILYALPSEAWRIRAYQLMDMTAHFTRWNDALERIQGSLLGYTNQQNDSLIEYRRRNGLRWGLQTMYKFVADDDVNKIREAGCKAFPVGAKGPILLYQPYHGQSDPIAALATLHRTPLTRFYAPKRRLLEYSKGVTEVLGAELEVFELSSSDAIKLNELIDGTIELVQLPQRN